ncbi:MAG: hypothetical protein M3N30_00695 [Bacteroidota bacterium]|nr:hypothetical protein [Bacteroidota bacterium]
MSRTVKVKQTALPSGYIYKPGSSHVDVIVPIYVDFLARIAFMAQGPANPTILYIGTFDPFGEQFSLNNVANVNSPFILQRNERTQKLLVTSVQDTNYDHLFQEINRVNTPKDPPVIYAFWNPVVKKIGVLEYDKKGTSTTSDDTLNLCYQNDDYTYTPGIALFTGAATYDAINVQVAVHEDSGTVYIGLGNMKCYQVKFTGAVTVLSHDCTGVCFDPNTRKIVVSGLSGNFLYDATDTLASQQTTGNTLYPLSRLAYHPSNKHIYGLSVLTNELAEMEEDMTLIETIDVSNDGSQDTHYSIMPVPGIHDTIYVTAANEIIQYSTGPVTPPAIICTDPLAINYNQPGTCIYNAPPIPVPVCTDPLAINFMQPGTCVYPPAPAPVPPTAPPLLPCDLKKVLIDRFLDYADCKLSDELALLSVMQRTQDKDACKRKFQLLVLGEKMKILRGFDPLVNYNCISCKTAKSLLFQINELLCLGIDVNNLIKLQPR